MEQTHKIGIPRSGGFLFMNYAAETAEKQERNVFIYTIKLTGMKKLYTLLIIFLVCFNSAKAQASVTTASYNKTSQPALMLELPYDETVCEDFILANLKKTGYDVETKGKLFWKQNKLNGYYTFKDVRLQKLDHTVDLYFKVDQKGRKSKNESIIYMLIGRGENYFISSSDDKVYDAAKNFMNGFVEEAAAFKLDLDIKNQEELVKEAEKKLDKLRDNEKDMNKKMEQLQKDLKQNQEDQKAQEKTIDTEKKKLEDLKSLKES